MILKDYALNKKGTSVSSLQTFMQCKEKARLYLNKWVPSGSSMGMTYGSICHTILEIVYQKYQAGKISKPPALLLLKKYIAQAEAVWKKENPLASAEDLQNMELSLALAEATLPGYFRRWKEDFKSKQFVSLESWFEQPYTLPSIKKDILLRGRIDGTFRYTTRKGLWILENKFFKIVDENNIIDTLCYDFQVLFYAIICKIQHGEWPKGLLYSVIRRSSFRQGKKESMMHYIQRCASDIAKKPDYYFYRFEVEFDKEDYLKFSKELDILLNEFALWTQGKAPHYKNTSNCITKYGRCPYILVCSEGDYIGLHQKKE